MKKESLAVTVGDKNIAEISEYSIIDLKKFMDELTLTDRQKQIGRLVLKEIRSRLGFLVDVGLDYLSLARATATLSGGEAQRTVWRHRLVRDLSVWLIFWMSRVLVCISG